MKFPGLWFSAILWLAPAAASSHEGSTGFLMIEAEPGLLRGRFDIALVDVATSLPLDADADGRLNWNEIQAGQTRIADFLGNGLTLSRGDFRCETDMGAPWLTERLGLIYLSVDVTGRCDREGPVGIASSLFFDRDDLHRLLVSMNSETASHLATLSPASRQWREPAAPSGWRTALDFLRQGAWHVWIGYDHLLFLLLLILPAAALRGSGPGRGRAAALDLVRIVTAFTIAHSITLGLAATGILRLPQQPVEATIAVSIMIAAFINLAPRLARFRLPLAFGFGLVHGFGFANALAGLDSGGATLPALAGFNVGVELANLAVIAAALPVLLWLGRRSWYAPRALPSLSLVAAAIGAAWLIERL
jgi:HupE/UreJ protein